MSELNKDNWLQKLFIDQAKPALDRHEGSGSGDLVEVTELPSVVDESKVYRVNGNFDAGVYVIGEEGFPFALKELIKDQIGVDCQPEYSVVENLPNNPIVSDLATFSIIHIYIMYGIAYLYANVGHGNMWLGLTDVFASMGFAFPAKGFTDDIYSETEIGIYTTYLHNLTAVPNKTAYIYNGTDWVRTDRDRSIILKEVEELTVEDFKGLIGVPRYFQCAPNIMDNGLIDTVINNKLVRVTIPEGIISIGDHAFMSCRVLKDVVLPEGLKGIGDGAFRYCVSLTNITIPNSVLTIGDDAFLGCYGLVSLVIPNSVTSIGYCSFGWCESLTTATIGSGVTYIKQQAFSGCNKLKRVDFSNHTMVPTADRIIFDDTHADLQIKVPANLIDQWKTATNWTNYASKIVTEFTNEV